jgi:hypothetical protein
MQIADELPAAMSCHAVNLLPSTGSSPRELKTASSPSGEGVRHVSGEGQRHRRPDLQTEMPGNVSPHPLPTENIAIGDVVRMSLLPSRVSRRGGLG